MRTRHGLMSMAPVHIAATPKRVILPTIPPATAPKAMPFGSTTTPAWCAMLTYKPKKWGQIFDFDISIFINITCQIKRSDPFSYCSNCFFYCSLQ